jgi:uracil-DNA glycosylase family 4
MRVESDGPTDAKIMFVGEAPGVDDEKTSKPFSGYAGTTFNNILAQAGIARYQCLLTNVAKERPPAGKISYFFEDKKCTIPKFNMQVWVEELKRDIELYRPNIVIAMGSIALWALTGEKSLSELRGYVLESTLVHGVKIISTYHPQTINWDWKLYFQAVLDLRKAIIHSNTPKMTNAQQIFRAGVDARTFINYMEECIADLKRDKIAIDVETVQPGSHIEELGLSHDANFGISIYLLLKIR